MFYWTQKRIKELKDKGYKLHNCTGDINCKEPTCSWYKEREKQEAAETNSSSYKE